VGWLLKNLNYAQNAPAGFERKGLLTTVIIATDNFFRTRTGMRAMPRDDSDAIQLTYFPDGASSS